MQVVRTPADDGGEHIKFGDAHHGENHMHHVPPIPAGMEHEAPANWISNAHRDLWNGMDQAASIKNNKLLSDLGKAEQLTPIHARMIESAAKLHTSLERYESEFITAPEAAMFRLPEVNPGNFYMSARASEIRQWYEGLPQSERMQVAARPDLHREIVCALLDSPIGLNPEERQLVKTTWEQRCRDADPELTALLDARRAVVERGRRVAGMITGTTAGVTRWDSKMIAEHLAEHDNEYAREGYKAFGISEADMARVRMIRKARKNAIKA